MNPGYVVNMRSGVLHDGEPSERCNSDQIADRFRRRIERMEELGDIEAPRKGWRACRYCFPRGLP